MDDQNPYRAPEALIADLSGDSELADLGQRLAAALLDVALLLCIMLPAMYFGGYFDAVMDAVRTGEKSPFTMILMWSGIGILVFVLVQGFPLNATGQTWGKRILGIKIVDLHGRKPSFARLLAMRYLSVNVVSLIPILGSILPLINVLMVFRKDRRCGHDLIAGTQVVKVRS